MMEMSAELTAAVLENILRHGKFNIPTKNAMENAVRILKDTPEVVRCQDCKHGFRLDDTNYIVCGRPFASSRETHTEEWYCADGVKK